MLALRRRALRRTQSPCSAADERSVKDPAKHEAGFNQAIERNLWRETGRKFMLECMTK
ncbi:MAG: hypothetical protein AB1773_09115 [Pseudomonadota bacterium]